MRWLIVRASAVLMSIILILGAIRLIGGLNGNPIQRELGLNVEQHNRLCPYNICVGRTKITEVRSILRSQSSLVIDEAGSTDSSVAWQYPSNPQIEGNADTEVTIDPTAADKDTIVSTDVGSRGGIADVTVGDAITLLGTPEKANLCYDNIVAKSGSLQSVWLGRLYYDGGKAEVFFYNSQISDSTQFDPSMIITSIVFSAQPPDQYDTVPTYHGIFGDVSCNNFS